MRQLPCRLLVASLIASLCTVSMTGVVSAGPEEGFEPIFDGKTLKDWDGNPKFWRVDQGAITGQTTDENPTKGNTFIVWTGGKLGDFELRLDYRILGGNSGIQYRSFRLKNAPDKWRIGGYQADIDSGDTFSGIIYGERARGILARRGQTVEINPKGKKNVVETFGDSEEIQSRINKEDWNSYRIVARGNHLVQYINGVKTAELIDNDQPATGKQMREGLLALQLHQGPPMKVQFKNIRLKRLSGDDRSEPNALRIELRGDGTLLVAGEQLTVKQLAARLKQAEIPDRVTVAAASNTGTGFIQRVIQVCQQAGIERFTLAAAEPASADSRGGESAPVEKKRIVFIAGTRSHGYGAHEHKAGCMLLSKALNESGLPVETVVVTGGWPQDESVLDDADSLVVYADGGGRHPLNAHIKRLNQLMKQGVGLTCIHYAVEVPKGKPGDAFLDWTGGYFETHWSVNPHWTAEYEKLPDHPITNGVRPFSIRDEWYYHMRFRPELQGVTPILTDLPPEETLKRKEGSHSNNPYVRKAVLQEKQPQHVAWARQREDGGRGFGFTGGHFHWNWGHPDFRKLVLNAIVWTAGLDVPEDGVPVKPLSVEDLMANQDYPVPDNFNANRIEALLQQWQGKDN